MRYFNSTCARTARWVCLVTAIVLAAPAAPSFGQRSIDGTGNNLDPLKDDWGAAGIQLRRLAAPAYADGLSALAGPLRPNPRLISNTAFDQTASITDTRGLTDFIWQWGQFVDHDITLTPELVPHVPANIPVPAGDPDFDLGGSGTVEIEFNRSLFDTATGTVDPRQQRNMITAWIDASNVYGSDATRAAALRSGVDGRLATSAGNLLPFNAGGLPNAGGTGAHLFLGGDVRANEQVGLIAMHTLFVREHNRLADLFKAANGSLIDQEIYDRARQVVGAEMQLITYSEFLPMLLGGGAISAYSGYRDEDEANPGITNEFSTALYRLGHSMLSSTILRRDNNGQPIPEGDLSLHQAFFNPQEVVDTGIDPILKGLSSQPMQKIDAKVIDDVRNLLFGSPEAGVLDLASLNIQRGRDHGLADYNTVRQALGVGAVTSFGQITSDTAVANALDTLYGGNINDIDLWVGMLAEDHAAGASVGPTALAALVKQFEALRDGDRFFYLNDPTFTATLAEINLTLAQFEALDLKDIIHLNTDIYSMQANAFLMPEPGTLALVTLGVVGMRRRSQRR